MAKKPVVKIFDPKKDIILTTDSISRILSQEGHPIMYLSRRLNLIIQMWKKKSWPLCEQPVEPENF